MRIAGCEHRDGVKPMRRSVSFAVRSLLLFGFWLLLFQPESWSIAVIGVDWAVGGVTSIGAALLSLRLLPTSSQAPRPWPLLRFGLRFLTQSLIAGVDVARRALDPRLPLDPGLLCQPTGLPRGTARALFGAAASQVPGTLAVAVDDDDGLLFHCLDRGRDVAAGLATDEALFLRIARANGGTARVARS